MIVFLETNGHGPFVVMIRISIGILFREEGSVMRPEGVVRKLSFTILPSIADFHFDFDVDFDFGRQRIEVFLIALPYSFQLFVLFGPFCLFCFFVLSTCSKWIAGFPFRWLHLDHLNWSSNSLFLRKNCSFLLVCAFCALRAFCFSPSTGKTADTPHFIVTIWIVPPTLSIQNLILSTPFCPLCRFLLTMLFELFVRFILLPYIRKRTDCTYHIGDTWVSPQTLRVLLMNHLTRYVLFVLLSFSTAILAMISRSLGKNRASTLSEPGNKWMAELLLLLSDAIIVLST